MRGGDLGRKCEEGGRVLLVSHISRRLPGDEVPVRAAMLKNDSKK